MKEKRRTGKTDRGFSLLLSISLVFCILGAVVFFVSKKISIEMSDAAVQNLSESLNLIKSTIEAILNKEAEFQKLMAQELALAADPEAHLQAYAGSQTMVKVSIIWTGDTEGVSDNGEEFSEEGLDFSAGGMVNGVAVSQSYLNHMGTWAYTMKCPVVRDGEEAAMLYVEYIYDSLDRSLPAGFYNKKAMLYIMDAETERLVLKPKGMGERDAGHLNLKDFYRANNIQDEELLEDVIIEVKQAIEMCSIYSNVLSNTMDAFASIISNNLNIVMKVLTALTIVMALPDMVFGLYGMNVSGLPFPNFWFAMLVAGILVAVCVIILWKKDMFK